MGKKRVYEIAKDEGLPSSLVLQRLQRAGMTVKTASSTIDVDWALHALNPKRYPRPAGEMPHTEPVEAKKKAPEPEPVEPEATPEETEDEAPSRPRPTRPRPRRPRGSTARQATPPPAEPAVVETPPAPEPEAPVQPAPVAETPEPVRAEEPPATPEPAPAPEAAPPAAAEAPAPVEEAPAAEESPATVEPAPAEPAGESEPAPATEAPESAPAETAAQPAASTPAPEAGGTPAPPAEDGRDAAPSKAGADEASAPEESTADGRGRRDDDRRAPRPNRPDQPASAGQRANRGRPGRPGGGRPGGPPGQRGGPADGRRGRPRRVVIDAQAGRRGGGPGSGGGGGTGSGGQGGRQQRGGGRQAQEQSAQAAAPARRPVVEIPSGANVKEVSEALEVSSAQIIKLMMGLGEMVTLTQSLSNEAIELLATELEREVTITSAEDELEVETFEDDPADLVPRAPVVTVMGHVDHGKTSLLDSIRSTEVAAGEAGGITQHIGAYQVHHDGREITFLDTPGHEAFTAMRARGAKITDVAVIVVAADDGVMPQTIEAIDHAKAAEVPFMVAVNKIDKEGANPDRVRQELSQREVIPSDWGGTHEFVNVSAKQGDGIESLLETVLLVADADAEPTGNPSAEGSGTVIESRLDPGRGPICTLLVQRGTLRVGDVILAGEHYGRVRAMNGFSGEPIDSAGPSVPAEILGLSGVPDAGDRFRVFQSEREARQRAMERSQRLRAEELANRQAPVSLDDLFDRIKEGGLKELNIIVKGDVQGSVGALVDALSKMEQTEVRLRIIHTGVGAVTESDVNLASASQAIIIGFNVRPRPEAKVLAEREGVDIRTYRVIYRAIEDVRDALVGLLEPDIVEETLGTAEVRATFRSSRLGTIAGCYVTEGTMRRGANARLLRDDTVVHEGKIGSIRRVNDDVREVTQGFECGILLEDYNDIKDGDVIEAFDLREVARTAQHSEAASDGE
ncbi:MAG: translation initiation factor IF-2 [Thermoleophilia bacterium]